MNTSSFSQKVINSFLWLSTGTFLTQFVSWCSTIIVIRLLEPSDYGLMAMATIFIGIMTVISELGISASIIQAIKISKIEIGQLYTVVIVSNIFGFILCQLTAPLVAWFFHEERVIDIIRVASVNFVLISLYMAQQSLLVRQMDFKTKAKIDIYAQIGATCTTLIMAISGYGVWSLIAGYISIHMIKAFSYNIIPSMRIKPHLSLRGASRLIKFGTIVTGDRLLYYWFAEVDKLILGKMLGEKLLGIYAVAMNLASLPAEKVLPIISQVTFTSYSRIQQDVERIKRNTLRTVRVISAVSFPFFFGMAAVGPEAISLVLGAKWNSLILPFQVLCLIMPLKSMSPIFPPAVFALGRPKVNLVNMAIAVLLMTTAFLIGVQKGILGVCLAWIIVYPITFSIITYRAAKIITIRMKEIIGEMIYPLLISTCMLLCILLARKLNTIFEPLQFLALSICLGAIFYIGIMFIFRKDKFYEIKSLLRKNN